MAQKKLTRLTAVYDEQEGARLPSGMIPIKVWHFMFDKAILALKTFLQITAFYNQDTFRKLELIPFLKLLIDFSKH